MGKEGWGVGKWREGDGGKRKRRKGKCGGWGLGEEVGIGRGRKE